MLVGEKHATWSVAGADHIEIPSGRVDDGGGGRHVGCVAHSRLVDCSFVLCL